jgi:hypothetical protein
MDSVRGDHGIGFDDSRLDCKVEIRISGLQYGRFARPVLGGEGLFGCSAEGQCPPRRAGAA